MTPAQQRALLLGAQLHETNRVIGIRAGMARTASNRGGPLAAWLLKTAELAALAEELRCQLRGALADLPAPRHASPYWQPPSAAAGSAGIYRGGRHAAD